MLNNYFSEYKKLFIPGDIQFDGTTFSGCSVLLWPLQEMVQMAKVNGNKLNILNTIQEYMALYDLEALAQMLNEEAGYPPISGPSFFSYRSSHETEMVLAASSSSMSSTPLDELIRITQGISDKKWKQHPGKQDEFSLKLADSNLAEQIRDYLQKNDIRGVKILGGNKVVVENVSLELLSQIQPITVHQHASTP